MKNSLFLISIILLITSCNSIKEIDNKEIKVLYNNGNLYCKGNRRIYKKGTKKFENRIGLWNFYYPDKTLELQIEYDHEGDIVNYKTYSQDCKILILYTYTELDENVVVNEKYFYDTGELEIEILHTVETGIDEDEQDYEIELKTIKEYYKNGNILEQTEYEDGIRIYKKRWDKYGKLILKLEYKKGLINQ